VFIYVITLHFHTFFIVFIRVALYMSSEASVGYDGKVSECTVFLTLSPSATQREGNHRELIQGEGKGASQPVTKTFWV
jgi:nitrogen fixation protein FixH